MNAKQKRALTGLQNLARFGGTLDESRMIIGLGVTHGLCNERGELTSFALGYLNPTEKTTDVTAAELRLALDCEGLVDIATGKTAETEIGRMRAKSAAIKVGLITQDGTMTSKGERISRLQGRLSRLAA